MKRHSRNGFEASKVAGKCTATLLLPVASGACVKGTSSVIAVAATNFLSPMTPDGSIRGVKCNTNWSACHGKSHPRRQHARYGNNQTDLARQRLSGQRARTAGQNRRYGAGAGRVARQDRRLAGPV